MPSFEAASTTSPRLLLVSNRLPVAIKRSGPNDYEFTPGSGGLVSGLAGLSKSTEFLWYGWPGLEIPKDEMDDLSNRLRDECGVVPVFLDDALGDLYYNGFANSILWPLIHYHPGEVVFSEDAWTAYQTANRSFAKVIARDVQDGDLIWIHDYHLMLLPAMLREEIDQHISVKIGFFLHTPFPSSEIYRILPVRNEILLGVLHSDLIGFHTNAYARHFLSSCSIVLGIPTTIRNVLFKGRVVTVGAFPIGIQPEKFTQTLAQSSVRERITALEHEFRGKTVMVGVDRLDYMKGVPQKLRAFELFLSEHPEYVGRVKLIQVAIPTRGEVEEYQNLRALVNEQIGRINGNFGTIEYTPIHFMHQTVDFSELLALYAVSDVCVVASTRDGMNLVSFEYIACQQQRHGSLILSEFAGSAQSLDGSIIVNPWNIFEMARAMYQAVNMDEDERSQRFELMNAYVQNNTSAFWGQSFVKELKRVGEEPERTKKFGKDPPPIRIDWRSYDGPSCYFDVSHVYDSKNSQKQRVSRLTFNLPQSTGITPLSSTTASTAMAQDLPPSGGYSPVQYKRNLPARGFKSSYYLFAIGIICTYGLYKAGVGIREQNELAREKMWSRIHLIPMLQAEEDRDLVRRQWADQAREKELLGAETKVYHTDRFIRPTYAVTPSQNAKK